jgi:hypothetical protein
MTQPDIAAVEVRLHARLEKARVQVRAHRNKLLEWTLQMVRLKPSRL